MSIERSNNERGPFRVFQEGAEKRQLAKANRLDSKWENEKMGETVNEKMGNTHSLNNSSTHLLKVKAAAVAKRP